MKRGLAVRDEFYITCKYCGNDIDLVKEKRATRKTEPIRCKYCGKIIAR